MLTVQDQPVGSRDAVALITPSYRGDLERCRLLFETVDRHLTGRGPHYVIVHDEDVPLFAPHAAPGRIILPSSRFLPWTVRHFPLRWRGRHYWVHPYGKPLSGWHVQQIVKIAAAASLPQTRYWILDSDLVFFRDFDLSRFAAAAPVPILAHPNGITAELPRHVAWIAAAHRLLGLPAPTFPALDCINHLILWDQATLSAALARIEATSGRGWTETLCRERDFSEYLIYGSFVTATQEAPCRHDLTTDDPCRTHWGSERLDAAGVLDLMREAGPKEIALCIQSFGETLLSEVRRALESFEAVVE